MNRAEYHRKYGVQQKAGAVEGVTNNIYSSRVSNKGWSKERALSTPVRQRHADYWPECRGVRVARKVPCTKGEASNKTSTVRYTPVLLHRKWAAMRARCYSTKCKSYKRYGGRGIAMHDEWRDNYRAFAEWAKPLVHAYKQKHGTFKGMSIDRIDPDGNYEPGNCQFIPLSENSQKRWADRREAS
jgi:hypothetical protein